MKTFSLWLLVVILLGLGVRAHMGNWHTTAEEQDIYYSWVEGGRILNGENPYARILDGDMRVNRKYATYFPLFYLLSALTQYLGLHEFSNWLGFWRTVYLAFNLGCGALLFFVHYRRNRPLLGIIVLTLWLFNIWSLSLTFMAHFDWIPIFFLLLSLIVMADRPYGAGLVFSLSLALKQIAVFLVPLYVIWYWHESREHRLKRTLYGLVTVMSLPLLFSGPFLLWQPEGYVRSILFSVTRDASYWSLVGTQRVMFGGGLVGRLPMFAVMAAIYYLVWQRKLSFEVGAMFTMLAFVAMSPVVFPQYIPWLIALVLFLPYESVPGSESRHRKGVDGHV